MKPDLRALEARERFIEKRFRRRVREAKWAAFQIHCKAVLERWVTRLNALLSSAK